MAIHIGSWGTPELGITEGIGALLGRGKTSQGGSNIIGGGQKSAAGSVLGTGTQQMYGPMPNQSTFTPPATKKVGGTGTGGTSGGVSGVGFGESNMLSPNSSLGGGPSQIDTISAQFNDFNSYLDSQESQANSSFNETKGLYDTQKTNAENQYKTEQATQTEGIKKNESLNLAKVRQLLGDLQQGNAARTAITGGGSTSDVLAERFGRESQSRLGNVMDQTRQALTRVSDFYNNAITKLNESYQTNLAQAKQILDSNIAQIRGARVQSAAQKQNATVDAWKGYYDQVNQAKVAAQQFKAQYDLWKDQQDQAYAAVSPFNDANAQAYNTGTESSFSPVAQAQGMQQGNSAMAINPMYRTNRKQQPDDQQYWQDQFGITPSYNTVG